MSILDNFQRPIDLLTIQKILNNPLCDQKCITLHGGDCNVKAFIQYFFGVQSLFKIYMIAHLVPLLLFKFRKLRKDPRKELAKFFLGLAKSLMFAGLTSAIAQRTVCFLVKHFHSNYTIAHYPASVAGLSLLLESPSRQAQIAIYCTAYTMMKRRSLPVVIPMGNLWINAVSLAIIAFIYMNDPQVFRAGYKNAIRLILKDI